MSIILSQHSHLIASIIKQHSYHHVVLQIPKNHLKQSFKFTAQLRLLTKQQQVEFYTLYDSLKNQCCTDIIGAKHINYDALFHFGYACFSQSYHPNHHYIMPEYPWPNCQEHIDLMVEEIKNNGIGLVICDQSMYVKVSRLREKIEKTGECRFGRLAFEREEGDNYFGFGYYYKKNSEEKELNVLIVRPTLDPLPSQLQQKNTQLLQNLYLCKKSLGINQLFTFSLDNGFGPLEINTNKRVMQRLSQIGELQKYTTFGILVSNPSTTFCQKSIKRCRYLLQSKGLKHFTFMMNNLNQCKLGNFPQIEVYIVISCYNHSLYSIKDFFRLVVTPMDIEIAFGGANYEEYIFDLEVCSKSNTEMEEKIQQMKIQEMGEKEGEEIGSSLAKINNQLAIQEIIQSLDFYREREYKGLDFSEKKEVQKIKKGKIGIAQQYRPLEDSSFKQ